MRLLLCFAILSVPAESTAAGLLSSVWVEFGEGRTLLARVVVDTLQHCPSVHIGAKKFPMIARTPVPDGMMPVCEISIPAGVTTASVGGQPLALPHATVAKVVVIGDTGCRIKGKRIQDCNDPAKWPLQRVSERASADRPDLVIHVGDYLYREDKCPDDLSRLCGTGPAGDRWDTWNADFFAPASKLLTAAPWAFSRGNHEDCTRAWKGWFYYLDPRPWNGAETCVAYSDPYLVQLGSLQLFMLDSSAAKEQNLAEEQIGRFAEQLGSLRTANAWIVDHHPFWAMKAAAEVASPLAEAWKRTSPKGVSMVVSGHTHLFELLSFGPDRPPQLVAGDGGTNLAEPLPAALRGVPVRGVSIVEGTSSREFGYTLLRKSGTGWKLELKGPLSGILVTCKIQGHEAACQKN